MLGGRNIAKWQVKSNEYIWAPHTAKCKYGIPVKGLAETAPKNSDWLNLYHGELLAGCITVWIMLVNIRSVQNFAERENRLYVGCCWWFIFRIYP